MVTTNQLITSANNIQTCSYLIKRPSGNNKYMQTQNENITKQREKINV